MMEEKQLAMSRKQLYIAISIIILSLFTLQELDAQIQKLGFVTFSKSLMNDPNRNSVKFTLDENSVRFNFNTYADYKNGLGGKNSEYRTSGRIKSDNQWVLSYEAIEPFLHEDGISEMALDNVGLTVRIDDKYYVINYAEEDPLKLSSSPTVLMRSRERGNKSNNNPNNFFDIYWEMGTRKGDLNQKSLLEQNLKSGEYQTKVELIWREEI